MTPLDTLIHRFLDDQRELSADELDELIAGLRADAARAVAVREQLIVDDLVAQKLTVDRRNFLAQVEQRITDFERSEDEIDNQVAELHQLAASQIERPNSWSGNSIGIKIALALSLAMLVAGFFIAQQFLPRRAQPVAKVIDVQGAVTATGDEQPEELAPQETVFTGQEINTPEGGSLTLQYADQTQVRIEGESQVTLDADPNTGAKQVHIEEGAVWADVARQTAGAMKFVTPHAVATVLGTRLRLTVSKDDTILEVSEGVVKLDRAGNSQSIEVKANESGLATTNLLDLRTVTWPDQTDGLAYALDPFVRRVPRTRNPETGNMWQGPLDSVGDAAVNDLTDALELRGGVLHSLQDGEAIVEVSRDSSEFSLELVYFPATAEQAGPARIVGLEGGGRSNFILSQDGTRLLFTLLTDSGASHSPLAIELPKPPAPGKPTHLAISYRDGEFKAYQDGDQVAAAESIHGTLAAWQPGELAIGGDSQGHWPWKGTIEALAIYHRYLPAEEVTTNVRKYRLLAGRE